MMARNIIIWCFNMAIYILVVIYFGVKAGWVNWLFIPGFIRVCAAAFFDAPT